MKIETIRKTLKNKSLKKEFALITNLINGESEIFFPGHNLSGMFLNYSEEIEKIFHSNKSGIIENSEIFVQTYKNPIRVIVHANSPTRFLLTYAPCSLVSSITS